jgi:carboxylate-amine ligase
VRLTVPIVDPGYRLQARVPEPGSAVAAVRKTLPRGTISDKNVGRTEIIVARPGVLTLGVEEEFLVVDRCGRLAAGGPEVTDDVTEPSGHVQREFRPCQVESATEVCTEVAEVTAGLRALRTELAGEAAARRLRLLPSGTAILAEDEPPAITPTERYRRMAMEFGAVARATLTCACHVHVAIPDRAAGLAVSNWLRPWLPVLLALTANSPFHEGADTGYASWRHIFWQHWPSAGPPPHFSSVDHYESLVDALLDTGAILDRRMVYWDVRLSEHEPTLEVRISDVAVTVEEAALLAVLVRALAGRALDEAAEPGGKSDLGQDLLRARLWRSSRDGLSGGCVDPAEGTVGPAWRTADRLVGDIRSQLRSTGDEEFVTETLARLRETGGAAERQRAAFARRQRLTDVVDALVLPAP